MEKEYKEKTLIYLNPELKEEALMFVFEEYGSKKALSEYIENLIRNDLRLIERRMQERILSRICDDWGDKIVDRVRDDIFKEKNGNIYYYFQNILINAKSDLLHNIKNKKIDS